MSSRALRKVQKERERLEAEQRQQDANSSEDEVALTAASKKSVFEMLGETEKRGGNEVEEDEDEEGEEYTLPQQELNNEQVDHQKLEMNTSAKRKRKKKKAKPKPNRSGMSEPAKDDHFDEFVKAVRKTSIVSSQQDDRFSSNDEYRKFSTRLQEVAPLLAVDTHHLNVSNEMKRLFGKAAVRADREEEQEQSTHQQRMVRSEHVGLADAVKGAYSPYGAGLPAMIRRRNIFVQGKDGWPRAPGGGLSMQTVWKAKDLCMFQFMHNKAYQQAQKEFDTCVLSMDPSLMVNVLRFNPYHISSLLQVSEIAKHEKDYTTAGDLLERALFSFGRATHPAFASSLAQGKARLEFRRPENREFWLAGWRYLQNLGMRGTWRTALEWAKLLFSLDPVEDPYQMQLIIDQLALRARQPQQLLDWLGGGVIPFRTEIPNLEYSKSLALRGVGASEQSRDTLKSAIQHFPWVAVRLFEGAGVERVPQQIWGKQATGELDILRCELYVSSAIDLWKNSDALGFLRNTTGEVRDEDMHESSTESIIEKGHARHVLLTDKPALIGLLPRRYTSDIESSSDPVPPTNNERSYDTGVSEAHRELTELQSPGPPPGEMMQNEPEEFIRELYHVQRFFERLIPGFLDPVGDRDNEGEGHRQQNGRLRRQLTDEAVDRAINDSNLSISQMRARLFRLVALREQLVEQEGQVVRSEQGSEARMAEDGRAHISFGSEGEQPSRLAYLQEAHEATTQHDQSN